MRHCSSELSHLVSWSSNERTSPPLAPAGKLCSIGWGVLRSFPCAAGSYSRCCA
jgi:hypothetical protein